MRPIPPWISAPIARASARSKQRSGAAASYIGSGGHGEENEVPPQRRRRGAYKRHFRRGRRHSSARAADEMGGRGGKEGIRHLRGGHFSDVRGVGGAVVLARRAVPDGGAAVSSAALRADWSAGSCSKRCRTSGCGAFSRSFCSMAAGAIFSREAER